MAEKEATHASTRKTMTNKRFFLHFEMVVVMTRILAVFFFLFGGLLFFCTQLNKLLESDLYDICHFGELLLPPPQLNTSSCGFRIILRIFFSLSSLACFFISLLFILNDERALRSRTHP